MPSGSASPPTSHSVWEEEAGPARPPTPGQGRQWETLHFLAPLHSERIQRWFLDGVPPMMHSSPGCKLAVVWAAREGLGWGSWHLHGGLPGWCKSWQTLASGLMGPPERPDWRPGLSPSDPSSWTHYSRPLTGAAGLVPTGTSGALSPRRPGGGKGVGSRGRLAAASLPPETISCRQHLRANPRVRAAGGHSWGDISVLPVL